MPELDQQLTDIGNTTSTAPRGGRTQQTDPTSGAQVSSERPLDGGEKETPSAPTPFRRSFIDSQSREKMSMNGEEYLRIFQDQLTGEGLQVTQMPIGGAYVVHNDKYSMGVVFDEAVRRTVGSEFAPRAKVLNKIFTDNVVEGVLAGMDQEVLSTILLTTEDYGSKENSRAYAAANRIRNYLNLAVGAEASTKELEQYSYRIVTTPSVVDHNLAAYNLHGVAPYHMYGCTVDICMDSRAKDRRRYDIKEDDLEWSPLFTIGAITEILDYPDEDRPNIPVITITGYEGTFLSVKMLPLVLAVAYEIFISQGLWLEPFKNYGEKGRNLGQLYPDENGQPSRIKSRADMKEFLRNFVGDPILAIDVQHGHFTFPGFDILADGSLTRLRKELEDLTNGELIDLVDPVVEQFEYYTGTVADGDQIVDSRSIDYFRIVDQHMDDRLRSRFLNYPQQADDRVRAIAEAGFSNYSGNSNMLNVLYPTTKYLLSADAIKQMFEISSVLNIMRNTTRDDSPIIGSEMLRQQGASLHSSGLSLFKNRNTQSPRNRAGVGRIFGNNR